MITRSQDGPQCPYCKRQITADAAHYYDEANYTREECFGCKKQFIVEVCNTTTWTCTPIEETGS